MKKNIKILILIWIVFLLNSCFWYKLVKVEEIENNKNEVIKQEKKVYEPWTIWYRLHREEQEKTEENTKQETSSWKIEENKEKQEDKKEENKQEKWFKYSSLATIEDFWDPIKKWNWVISSKNYNLYIFKDNSPILENIDSSNLKEFFSYHEDEDIEDLTKYISSMYNIFYRNTARTIKKDKWFTFFVIHAEKDKYIYEKHYIDLKKKLHWILFLDKWNLWEVKNIKEKLEKLKEKNTELKQITDFSEIPSANKIFSEIVNKDNFEEK